MQSLCLVFSDGKFLVLHRKVRRDAPYILLLTKQRELLLKQMRFADLFAAVHAIVVAAAEGAFAAGAGDTGVSHAAIFLAVAKVDLRDFCDQIFFGQFCAVAEEFPQRLAGQRQGIQFVFQKP
jgi:hypothetical protein